VLAALYNAAKPQGMGFTHYDPAPMTLEQAEQLLKRGTDFDYLKGRVMKINLCDDTLDTWGYDRDNGEGAAAAVIGSLRSTGDVNCKAISKTHSDRTFFSALEAEAQLAAHSHGDYKSDGMIVFEMGLGDFKDQLGPRIKKAKEDNVDK
ncbi:hypothetical protein KJ605_00935, partial [Patescibacteria group bacterium]|nr:hypothetical protein [Patescibacteria group bacterium]